MCVYIYNKQHVYTSRRIRGVFLLQHISTPNRGGGKQEGMAGWGLERGLYVGREGVGGVGVSAPDLRLCRIGLASVLSGWMLCLLASPLSARACVHMLRSVPMKPVMGIDTFSISTCV